MVARNSTLRAEASGQRISTWIRLLPIIFFEAYLNATVFLFAYGPWPWPVADGTKLYLFLALAHTALLLGYLSGAFGRPGGYRVKWKVERVVLLSLIANALLLIPTSVTRTGSAIPNVIAGLSNPGAAYGAGAALVQGGLVEYARIALGPILSLLFPLTVYYWQRLRWSVKVLAATSIASFLSVYLATGTNKAIADFVILTPFLLLASYLAGFLGLNRRRIAAVVASGIVLVGLFLWFFTVGQTTRPGSGAVSGYFPLTRTFADPENFLVQRLPPEAKTGAIALATYLTQGYYALYLSLEEPFVPMFGVGNSMFLFRNAARLTGSVEIEEMPYPVRIEKQGKWDAYGAWSSIYPWIASDVSFPGTILVVFLIGRLFAFSWLDALRGKNPFAVAVFSQLIIMLFYFPANNQLLQSGESLTAFCGMTLLWLVTRTKYVWRAR